MKVRTFIALAGIAATAVLVAAIPVAAADSLLKAPLTTDKLYAAGEASYAQTLFGPRLDVTFRPEREAALPPSKPFLNPAPQVVVDSVIVGTMKWTPTGTWALRLRSGTPHQVPKVRPGSDIEIRHGLIVIAQGTFN